ncbi:cupin domain-containing protein [Paucibacter sp. JuS9]|uniref:cupin domain-containing protein n=1 Tax=Paucibacter sp. JuS9 TaxID=3228748 RepID=UPI0037581637
MLERPHTEFIQAQRLPWRRLPPGAARPDAEYKYLSRDARDGACSCLIRYPAGWSREATEALATAEEFYVLEGALEIDGLRYGADHHGYLPAHWPRHRMSAPHGAVVLTFFDSQPEFSAAGAQPKCDAQPLHLDVLHMPWDMSLNDPNLAHLGISRKNLRAGADGSRSLLSMILPHSEPPRSRGPRESHPVVEECYVLSGSLVGPMGEMQAGAYFWRPPGIPHGPFGTRWGCVALIRFLGGRHVNLWSPDEAPFDFDAPYRPVLPQELAPMAALPALEQPPRY